VARPRAGGRAPGDGEAERLRAGGGGRLRAAGFRVEGDYRNEKLGYKSASPSSPRFLTRSSWASARRRSKWSPARRGASSSPPWASRRSSTCCAGKRSTGKRKGGRHRQGITNQTSRSRFRRCAWWASRRTARRGEHVGGAPARPRHRPGPGGGGPDGRPSGVPDHGLRKFKYITSKREQEARKKQTVIQVKEIKVRPKTEEHDLNTKLKHIRRFLEEGTRSR